MNYIVVGQAQYARVDISSGKPENLGFYTTAIASCVALYIETDKEIIFAHILSADFKINKKELKERLDKWVELNGKNNCFYWNTKPPENKVNETTLALTKHLKENKFCETAGASESCLMVDGKFIEKELPLGKPPTYRDQKGTVIADGMNPIALLVCEQSENKASLKVTLAYP